ncbi:hypothetical protein AURDEDRAFT_181570 [Auricularia subglabra TFB-10046 SS5]|nr:hypothetical protein AURDEDRAFT_181570 [Auricularia subglabra TFB-10046 SS5]
MSRHHLALFIALSCIALASAAAVDDADDRIAYSAAAGPSSPCRLNAVDAQCVSNWWPEHSSSLYRGTAHTTYGPDASVSFSFTGSAIHLVGSTFPRGARAQVVIDDRDTHTLDFTDSSGARRDGVRLFSRRGLDASPHTIRISYDPTSYEQEPELRRFMAIDAFILEDAQDASPFSPSSPSSISSSSGTLSHPLVVAKVRARREESPSNSPEAPTAGRVPTINELYASDDTTTSPAPNRTQWSPVPGKSASSAANMSPGHIAAIAVVSGFLSLVLGLALIWCIRTRFSAPQRVRPSSRRGESILSWGYQSQDGAKRRPDDLEATEDRTRELTMPRLISASVVTAAATATTMTMNLGRVSTEAQRPISREIVPSPISPSPITPSPVTPSPASASSTTPLNRPRRAASASSRGAGSSSRRAPPPAPLELGPSNSGALLHPHAVPTPMGSPRFAEVPQTVVIPASPAPTAAPPPPYTPRSRGKSPRTLAELREKMSPYTPTRSPSSR